MGDVTVHMLVASGRQRVGRSCAEGADKDCQRRDGNKVEDLVERVGRRCSRRGHFEAAEASGWFAVKRA